MVMWLTSAHRLAASHSLLLPCCCEPRDASGVTSRNAALSAVKMTPMVAALAPLSVHVVSPTVLISYGRPTTKAPVVTSLVSVRSRLPVRQSVSAAQAPPSVHLASHVAPPQSIQVSRPLFFWLKYEVQTRPSHCSLMQSVFAAQTLFGAVSPQLVQSGPPQSIAVSAPFSTPSEHEVQKRSAEGAVARHWVLLQSRSRDGCRVVT